MNAQEYLEGVNKFWKPGQGDMQSFKHCIIAIDEELGEVSGWYKKAIGYGVDRKNPEWRTGLKGELGDLCFYLTKLSEIIGWFDIAKFAIDEDRRTYMNTPRPKDLDMLTVVAEFREQQLNLLTHSMFSQEFKTAIGSLFRTIFLLAHFEEFDVEDILVSNLAKLQTRHREKFSEQSVLESGRDRAAEDKAIN